MQSKKSLAEDALARVLKLAYEKADREDGQCLGCKGVSANLFLMPYLKTKRFCANTFSR